jgi:FkbM family methyltransferase
MKLFHDWFVCDNDGRYMAKYRDKPEQFLQYGKDIGVIIEQFCERRSLAIDCGAHYGLVSVWLSKYFDSVHSFEVETEVASCLESNMEHHNCNNVTVHKCGLLDYIGNGNIESMVGKSTSLSTFVSKSSGSQTNKIITIDSLNLSDLDFLKIDVEGGEQSVVRGAIETIKRCKPVIYYEINYGSSANLQTKKTYGETRFGETQSVLQILEPLGYKVVREDEQTKNKSYNITLKAY